MSEDGSAQSGGVLLVEGQSIDAVSEATFCSWSGLGPLEIERQPLERRSDGAWLPVLDPATGEPYVGLEWDEPRDIQRVIAELTGGSLVRVEYWRHNWPTPAPERRPGARRGWIGQDDPWHGEWTVAKAAIARDGEGFRATFDPVDFPEIPDRRQVEEAADYAVTFRRTLKLRLVLSREGGEGEEGEALAVRAARAETPGVWTKQEVDVTLGCGRAEHASWDGHAAVYRGAVLAASVLQQDGGRAGDEGASTARARQASWRLRADGSPRTVRLAILRADSPSPLDRTVVTVATEQGTFSFDPADVVASGPLLLPDLGTYVAPVGGPSYEEYLEQIAPLRGKAIHDRVLAEPEQTVARAFAEVTPPTKTKQEPVPRYLPLGWEANRQEFALCYNGDVFCDKAALKVGGRDTARLLWPGVAIRYRFATGDPPDLREREDAVAQRLLDGYLPVVISTWEDRELRYEQTAFAAPLGDVPDDPLALRGDEDLVLFLRFSVRNRTEGAKRAQIWLMTEPFEELALEGADLVAKGRVVPAEPVDRQWQVQPYGRTALRASLAPGGGGSLRVVPAPREGAPRSIPSAVLYEAEVPGFAEHEVVLRIPFVTLDDEPARETVRALDWKAKLEQVTAKWRGFVAEGASVVVPDALITDFYKAAATHVAISVDRDPESGLYMVPAATYSYGTCANEGCLQIRQLDWRGYHSRARAYLETYLKTQGWRGLDGRFRSKEGVLRGLDVYGEEIRGNFNYNLDHGFIMRQLAEHYWLTRDRDWAEAWAPSFVAACDFTARERQATKRLDALGGPVPEYGLLPAGHLEDNREWRCWFAVNAWAYGGLRDLAAVLSDLDHPDAPRLQREADAYRSDILASLSRSRDASPAVRLRDGTAIPHTPTRAGLHGRAWGWFREGAYGPLHLVDNGLLAARSQEVTWILEDLEDNVFVSRQYGRPVDVERDWFSQGGVAIQANLLNNAVAYLRRDEVEHAVRALFDNLAASLYRDVRCFTEHPVVELGHGVGPFYKTPDECGFLNSLRQFLVDEEGPVLHLCRGIPRSWLKDKDEVRIERMATIFGPLSYWVRSEVAVGRITAEIDPPTRNAPAEISLRLRHPSRLPIREVRVEGAASHEVDPVGERVVIRPDGGRIRVEAGY